MFRFNSRVPLVRSSSDTAVRRGVPLPYLHRAHPHAPHPAKGRKRRGLIGRSRLRGTSACRRPVAPPARERNRRPAPPLPPLPREREKKNGTGGRALDACLRPWPTWKKLPDATEAQAPPRPATPAPPRRAATPATPRRHEARAAGKRRAPTGASPTPFIRRGRNPGPRRGSPHPALRATPSPEVTELICRLPLPTLSCLTRGCSPWRPVAVSGTAIRKPARGAPREERPPRVLGEGFSRAFEPVMDASLGPRTN